MASTSRRIKGRDRLIVLATGSEVTTQTGTAVYVAVPVATKLAIITQPAGAVDNVAFTTQPVVELQTVASAPVLQAGVTVTASLVVGAGTLIGSATAVTASNGRATFSGLGIDASLPPASCTVRFSASGLTSVDSSSFTVSASGALLFHSDWSTATGQSDAALRDTGKATPWSGTRQVGSSPLILTVVSASGRGFPAGMTNCLRVEHAAVNDGYWLEADGRWSAPAIGTTQYYRVYFRHEIADSAGTQGYAATHPMETEAGEVGLGNNTIALKFGSYGNGTYPWMLQCEGASFPFSGWTPGAPSGSGGDPSTLTKNVTYRLEWAITRTSATQYTLAMRIYGGDDTTLLYGNSTIYPWGGTTGQNLGVVGTGGSGTIQQLPMDTAHYTRWRFGKNGGFGAGAGNYVYWGGPALSQSDWCGPYTAAG